MNSVVSPCLSALFLLPLLLLLLLLLASSAYEQVCVLCSLSGAAAVGRSRCTAVAAKAVKNVFVASLWAPRPRVQPLAGGVGSSLL